jgi:hypothetical protein
MGLRRRALVISAPPLHGRIRRRPLRRQRHLAQLLRLLYAQRQPVELGPPFRLLLRRCRLPNDHHWLLHLPRNQSVSLLHVNSPPGFDPIFG